MNKELNNESIEKLAEYDFSKGVLAKYAKQYAEGTNVALLDPDVAKVFPDSEAVKRGVTRDSSYHPAAVSLIRRHLARAYSVRAGANLS